VNVLGQSRFDAAADHRSRRELARRSRRSRRDRPSRQKWY
jgi:hypothetical protein